MSGQLEILRWIRVGHPAYAVTWLHKGQYAAAGTEVGLSLFDLTGRRLLAYPPDSGDRPVVPIHQLVAADAIEENGDKVVCLGTIYVGARQGWLVKLSLSRQEDKVNYQVGKLYQATNDLHTLSLSTESDLIAIGHLAPGLTVLDTDGEVIWHRHPDSDNATNGRVWSVSLDPSGDAMYIGSAGSETNVLASVNARTGRVLSHRYYENGERVTGLAALPEAGGVAVVVAEDMYSGRVEVYSPDLEDLRWERAFYDPVTTVAADTTRPFLVISVGHEGRIMLIDTSTEALLSPEVSLKTLVNDIAIINGQMIAAATDDGHLVIVRYLPEEFSI